VEIAMPNDDHSQTKTERPPMMTEKRAAETAPGRKRSRCCNPRPEQVASPEPVLRFSPTAWAKLIFLRDLAPTEISGFGITPADDLLFVEDIRLVRPTGSTATVAFDDPSLVAFFNEQAAGGLQPEQFARVWVHTHPGTSAEPNLVDEETFARFFGQTPWAVMFILARGGATYARLRFNIGPGGELALPVAIDYSRQFPPSDREGWEEEYLACVASQTYGPTSVGKPWQELFREELSMDEEPTFDDVDWLDWWSDLLDDPEEFAHGNTG